MATSIGFHVSNGGNYTGIGDYMEELDAAGIPFGLVSIGNYGPLHAGVLLMRVSGVAHVLIYRVTDLDVADYSLDAATAALNHWAAVKAKLPPEFDKERVWICPINEPDKGRADWLGNFATVFAATAIAEGYKVTMFGWSGGEPEPEHWQTEGMRRYLELCAIKPDRTAVALHEYSYEPDVLNIEFPTKIGRFQWLFDACDSMGIARPTVHVTEFGWTHEEVPPPAQAMPQLAWAYNLYSQHPQIKIAAIWYLGSGFGGIANLAQRLIAPVTQFMLNAPVVDPTPPPIIPPPDPPPATYLHTRLIKPANIRRDPSTNNPAITPVAVKEGLELIKLADVTGQPVSGDNRWIKAAAFISRSYVTDVPGGKVKTNRPVNLRIVPTTYNNTAIVTLPIGVVFESLGNVKDESNSGLWVAVALYVWRPLAIDVEPGIRLASPLKIPLTITSPFNSPRSYPFAPTKKQLHEGLDWRTGESIPVLATEAGTVDYIRTIDPGYGYGLTIRVKHNNRYSSWYGHLSQIQVALGQTVARGQQIALSGRSGGSVHHLHCTVQDAPTGLDGYVIDNCIDFTLLMHPAVSLPNNPPVPEPGSKINLVPYFSPANGRMGDIAILKNNWGQGDERQQLQQEGNNLYVTKNSQYEQRILRAATIDLVLDTSPGENKYYTVSGTWLPREMEVGQSFTRSELVQFFHKDGCSPAGNPYTSTSDIKLAAKYASYKPENGISVQNVIELNWIINGRVEERYFVGEHLGLIAWQNAAGKRSWIVERIPQGQQEDNVRERGCFDG